MAQETGVQSQVKSYQRLKKWYLMMTLYHILLVVVGISKFMFIYWPYKILEKCFNKSKGFVNIITLAFGFQ